MRKIFIFSLKNVVIPSTMNGGNVRSHYVLFNFQRKYIAKASTKAKIMKTKIQT